LQSDRFPIGQSAEQRVRGLRPAKKCALSSKTGRLDDARDKLLHAAGATSHSAARHDGNASHKGIERIPEAAGIPKWG
jgi:hypothetical protein